MNTSRVLNQDNHFFSLVNVWCIPGPQTRIKVSARLCVLFFLELEAWTDSSSSWIWTETSPRIPFRVLNYEILKDVLKLRLCRLTEVKFNLLCQIHGWVRIGYSDSTWHRKPALSIAQFIGRKSVETVPFACSFAYIKRLNRAVEGLIITFLLIYFFSSRSDARNSHFHVILELVKVVIRIS